MPFLRSLLLVAVTSLTGCITVAVGGSRDDPDYDLVPPNGWEPLKAIDYAHAYQAEGTGSVLGVSSACDDVTKSTYESLLDSVTSSVPKRQVTEPAVDMPAGNMPGRMVAVRGAQGDVPLEMVAIVMKSGRCVYDVTLTGRQISQAERGEALRVAQSLKERPL